MSTPTTSPIVQFATPKATLASGQTTDLPGEPSTPGVFAALFAPLALDGKLLPSSFSTGLGSAAGGGKALPPGKFSPLLLVDDTSSSADVLEPNKSRNIEVTAASMRQVVELGTRPVATEEPPSQRTLELMPATPSRPSDGRAESIVATVLATPESGEGGPELPRVLPNQVSDLASVPAPNASSVSNPGQGGATSVVATPEVSVLLPLDHAKWGDAITSRIVWQVSQSHQQVQINLNPPELGPLEVRVKVSQDQASVQFVVTNVLVRDAVEEAFPRLREMLAQSGLNLADANVSHQQGQSSGRPNDDWRPHGLPLEETFVAEGGLVATRSVAIGLIDAYV